MLQTLEEILKAHGIDLYENNKLRNVVDVLEDLYLKVNQDNYTVLMQQIRQTEEIEGHIFDTARNRPYR